MFVTVKLNKIRFLLLLSLHVSLIDPQIHQNVSNCSICRNIDRKALFLPFL